MAGDPHARLRKVLGVGPDVILSDDEITKALALLPSPVAKEIRADMKPPADADPVKPREFRPFGGVRR